LSTVTVGQQEGAVRPAVVDEALDVSSKEGVYGDADVASPVRVVLDGTGGGQISPKVGQPLGGEPCTELVEALEVGHPLLHANTSVFVDVVVVHEVHVYFNTCHSPICVSVVNMKVLCHALPNGAFPCTVCCKG